MTGLLQIWLTSKHARLRNDSKSAEVGAVRKTTIQLGVDENMRTVFESDQGRAGQIPQRLTQSCVSVQRPSTSSGSCAKIAFPTHQLPEHPQLDAK